MMMRDDAHHAMLRELFSLPQPVTSVYFGFADPIEEDLAARAQQIRSALSAHRASPAALATFDSALEDLPKGSGSLALFIGEDGDHRAVAMPDAEVEDHAIRTALPCLLPVLEWRQNHPACVFAVLDRRGAEITVQPAGQGDPTIETVTGPDDEIERNSPGGWSQPRYQRRAEDSWHHNAGRVVDAVVAALSSSGARLLVLAGDVRALQYFEDQLPVWVKNDVRTTTVSGSRSQDGSQVRRPEEIAAARREWSDAGTRDRLESLASRIGPDGQGVAGVVATIHCLARGQVHELLVCAEPAAPEPATAWFGPEATDISEHKSGLRPGVTPSHGPLLDVLVRSAVLTDAGVWILPADLVDPPQQGVGALLRFPERPRQNGVPAAPPEGGA
jgi:hypothetical protein